MRGTYRKWTAMAAMLGLAALSGIASASDGTPVSTASERDATQTEAARPGTGSHPLTVVVKKHPEGVASGAEVLILPAFGRQHTLGRAVTDASGRVRFPALPPAPVLVLARHPALGVQAEYWDVRDPDPFGERSVSLTLVPGGELKGRVLDEAGAPVEGARVTVYDVGFPIEGVTDGAGRFSLDGLVRSYRWRLGAEVGTPGALRVQEPVVRVEADGFAPWTRAVPANAPADVTLRRLRRVTGRVLQGDRPVAGAEVVYLGRLQPLAPRPDEEPLLERRRVRTDEEGRFVLGDLQAWAGWVRAEHAASRSRRAQLDLTGSGALALDLALEQTVPFAARVVRASDGSPVPGAALWLSGERFRSDDAGRLHTRVVPGKASLTVEADGYAPSSVRVDVNAHSEAPVVVELEGATPLIVQVEPSRPVRDALVLVQPEGVAKRSDENGRVVFERLTRVPHGIRVLLGDGTGWITAGVEAWVREDEARPVRVYPSLPSRVIHVEAKASETPPPSKI